MDGMGAVDGEEKPGDHHAGMMAGQLNQCITLPETNIARGGAFLEPL